MLIQNEIQAMNKYLQRHTVVLGLHRLSIEMKDGIYDQDSDRLLICDQDALNLLVFAVKETLALLEFVFHSHLEVLKYCIRRNIANYIQIRLQSIL